MLLDFIISVYLENRLIIASFKRINLNNNFDLTIEFVVCSL